MSDFAKELPNMRQDYRKSQLDEHEVGDNPILLFQKWFAEANDSGCLEANAMTVATVDERLQPHLRVVLLKGLEEDGFVFFTNYQSDKGKQIAQNDQVGLLFFWQNLERQVRIEGVAEKVAAEVSDAYFESRPLGSQLGALVSPQSQRISSRDWLVGQYESLKEKYQDEAPKRPKHWGGIKVVPTRIEFWQGRSARLHDRVVFEKTATGSWIKHRLAP